MGVNGVPGRDPGVRDHAGRGARGVHVPAVRGGLRFAGDRRALGDGLFHRLRGMMDRLPTAAKDPEGLANAIGQVVGILNS
jgi:hypothetical protein